jgi:Fe-S-cluster-containing hydrogenase component 2
MRRGRVAVIECIQEIPCNPCEAACPFGAINVGEEITALPILDGDKCTGCGRCVSGCPGLAIFLVDKSRSDGLAEVVFPYEYAPLPAKGDVVTATDRAGRGVCLAEVQSVRQDTASKGTAVVSLLLPMEQADEVRGMRLAGVEAAVDAVTGVLVDNAQVASHNVQAVGGAVAGA